MELSPRTDPRHAFAAMDAMRALAAATVAISHIRDLTMVDYSGAGGGNAVIRAFYIATGFGHAGVIVFFVLSGFWIAKSVAGRMERDEGARPGRFWTGFLIDRISRLWLVLVPVLAIGAMLDWYGSRVLHAPLYDGHGGGMSIVSPIVLSAPVFVANMTFLQTLAAPVLGSNGPLWSLAFEFWYYLWFPALWLLAARRRPSPVLASFLVAAFNPLLLFGFLSWLCGAGLYACAERGKRRPMSRLAAAAVLAAGLLAIIALLALMRAWHSWWLDPLLALAFATFVLGLCLLDLPVPGLRPLSVYGAKASFSLYAIHFPLAALAAAVIVPRGRLVPSAASVALVCALLAGTILIAFLFSRLTEAQTGRVRAVLTHRLLRVQPDDASSSFTPEDMTRRLDEAR